MDVLLDDHVHYAKKLIDVGNCRLQAYAKSRYKMKETSLTNDQIIEIHEGFYMVESQSDPEVIYDVNTGCCIYGETIYHALNRVNFAGKYKLVWLSGRILQAIFAAYNDLFQIWSP